MESKSHKGIQNRVALMVLFALIALSSPLLLAQPAGRFVGTITATNGNTLTVKTDAGDLRQVQVPQAAVLQRVEPGQRDLSAAVTIQLGDLATGDRVLVKLDPEATGSAPQALQIITIKSADVALKQQQEREDWQLHGVGGLVKSVDQSSGQIVLLSGAGPTTKTITVRVSQSTVLKRYAPASVRFDLAQPAPIDAIHPGDQLRARGTRNPLGTEIDAAEVVSGSFRNIAGTITAVDPANSAIVVKDLATKKQVAVHIAPDAQMHALPDAMARMIAARLKGSSPQTGAAASSGTAQPRTWAGQQGGGGGNGRWSGQARTQGGGEMQQILNRAPAIPFNDLKKGEAVMLVSTAGTSDVTAITLLTGVEPLLEAPEASQNLLSNWSMGSGGAAEAEAQ